MTVDDMAGLMPRPDIVPVAVRGWRWTLSAIVDRWVREALPRHKWHIDRKGHVTAKGRRISLHREVARIAGLPLNGFVIDHVNCIGLDNRVQNLRSATESENRRNNRVRSQRTGFKGVKLTRHKTFAAQISVGDKATHLGTFKNPVDAARAYDAAAVRLFGEFARTNAMMGLL